MEGGGGRGEGGVAGSCCIVVCFVYLACNVFLSQAVSKGDSVDVKYIGWLFENNAIGKVSTSLALIM